jgi:hypothetical protein
LLGWDSGGTYLQIETAFLCVLCALCVENRHEPGTSTIAHPLHAVGWDEIDDNGWVAKCYKKYFNQPLDQANDRENQGSDWFAAANALVKANPDRFEYVEMQGIDF